MEIENTRKKKTRKSGVNLSKLFLERLKHYGITIKRIRNLSEVFPTINHRLRTGYSINNYPIVIAYDNSSGTRNVRYERNYWGLTVKVLENLAKVPKSRVIFLGGRNLSLEDRRKAQISDDLSSEATEWINKDLIEFVFIFSAKDLWYKLEGFKPPTQNFKFNFFLDDFRFVGHQVDLLDLKREDVQMTVFNRYDQLELPNHVIEALKKDFSPFFNNIKLPWELYREISSKISDQPIIHPSPDEKPLLRVSESKSVNQIIPPLSIVLEKKDIISQVISKLKESDKLSQKPGKYVQSLAEAFRMIGFFVEIADIPGDTDLVLDARLGSYSYRVILDAKTSGSGKIIESRINWPAILEHKEKRGADYVVIAGKEFAHGSLIKRAHQFGFILLRTIDIIRLIEIYQDFPYSIDVLEEIFLLPGFIKEHSFKKIIEDSGKRKQTYVLIQKIILKLGELSKDEPKPTIKTLYYELDRNYTLSEIKDSIIFLSSYPFRLVEYDEVTGKIKLLTSIKGLRDIFKTIGGAFS